MKDFNPIGNNDGGAALWSATPAWYSKSGMSSGGWEEDFPMSYCGFVPVCFLDAYNSASVKPLSNGCSLLTSLGGVRRENPSGVPRDKGGAVASATDNAANNTVEVHPVA